jgi:hypothetical protein
MDLGADRTQAVARTTVHLRTLSRHRVLVGAALVLSIVGFAVVSYRIRLPATFESRGYDLGSATAIVLVDAPRSRAVDINAGNGIQVLAFRAKLLADLAMKPVIIDAVAERMGVPSSLVVADPPLSAAAVSGASVTADDRRAYVVRTIVPTLDGGDNPIMTIGTRAPTPAAAERLAGAVIAALTTHLAKVSLRQGTPAPRRILLKQLAPAEGAMLRHGPRPLPTAATCVVVFLLACWLIIAISRLAARLRQVPDPFAA